MHWIEKYLLPPSCQLCGATAENDELCAVCASDVHVIDKACPCCALPNDDGSVCTDCQLNPPIWQQAHSALVYAGCVQTLLQHWKYQKHLSAERLLCETLASWLSLINPTCEATAVIAMPMHRQKLRKRGFNTAFRLAKVAADHYQLPLLTQAIERIQHTTAQAGLNRQQRQENLRHAFETKPEQLLGHQHILLIDDVYTTGATLHACSKSLQQMGVQKIDVMTLARALPPRQEAPASSRLKSC